MSTSSGAVLSGTASPYDVSAGARAGSWQRGWRLTLSILGLLLLLLVAGAFGWHWYKVGRFIESTDDAFIGADSVAVSSRVAGYVTELLVGDNQVVQAGQIIARIDDRDLRAAVSQSRAQLAGAVAGQKAIAAQQVEQQAEIAEAEADIESDRAQLQFAAQENQRAQTLSTTAAGTRQNVERMDAMLRQDVANLKHAEAAEQAARAKVTTLEAASDYTASSVEKSRDDLLRAELTLSYSTITAPISGIVGDRSVQSGIYAQPGLRLLTIVPTGRNLYITANYKETQIGRMQVGQPVRFTVDALGDHVFHGRVASFSPGTGAEFALLPPENATGNYTKITQRVPVRIALDSGDAMIARLRTGLSVEVDVDTH